MNENAVIAQRFVLDLGPYAAVLALFAAWVAYRANPLRAVNRYFALSMGLVGVWQLHVALARSTQNYQFWGPLALPYGGLSLILLFLIYDAAGVPNSTLAQRLRRNPLMMVALLANGIGVVLVTMAMKAPGLFPVSLRWIGALLLLLILLRAEQQRRKAIAQVNPHELMLFHLSAAFVSLVIVVFMLVRTPAGSRILSGATILFMVIVIAMLLSERVLDAKGSARIAMGYLLAVTLHAVLMFVPIGLYLLIGGEFTAPVSWGFLVLGGLVSYPVFVLAQRTIQRSLQALTGRAAGETREMAVAVAARAGREETIVRRVEELSGNFLEGVDVSLEVFSAQLHEASGEQTGRRFLVANLESGWLSPEWALRRLRGWRLNQVLQAFQEERLGAVIRHRGVRCSVVMFVGARRGGAQPITSEEMEALQEIAAIAATGIERVRALEEALQVHGMAEVGRIAAQFSHESRNQIEAILCVLEALRDGYEQRISPAHRAAVYQQAADLAANHNLALEMVRLRPERVAQVRTDLHALVRQSAEAVLGPRVRVQVAKGPATALADARLLRQVLLNLFRNSVQAAREQQEEVEIEVRFGQVDRVAFIDVSDNGPGVPVEIRAALFTRWATTKRDGTGLGLAFCREAMATMQGEILLLTSKSGRGACFRLTLPLSVDGVAQPSDRVSPEDKE